MTTKELSPREDEILELCVQGLTNDAIAHRLGISVGTVNTYWLRIRMKVGGSGRTDTVVRIIKDRAEKALREMWEAFICRGAPGRDGGGPLPRRFWRAGALPIARLDRRSGAGRRCSRRRPSSS